MSKRNPNIEPSPVVGVQDAMTKAVSHAIEKPVVSEAEKWVRENGWKEAFPGYFIFLVNNVHRAVVSRNRGTHSARILEPKFGNILSERLFHKPLGITPKWLFAWDLKRAKKWCEKQLNPMKDVP